VIARKRDRPYGTDIRPADPLSDLFGDAAAAEFVPLASLQTRTQPRRYFDPDQQQKLIASVRQHGILEPLIVRPVAGDRYELVAGERRYRAAVALQLAEVPVVIRDLSETEALQIALIENLQREELNPLEETEALLELLAVQLGMEAIAVPRLLYHMKNDWERLQRRSRSATTQGAASQPAPEPHPSENRENNVIPSAQSPEALGENNVMPSAQDLGVPGENNVMPSAARTTPTDENNVIPSSVNTLATDENNVIPNAQNPRSTGENNVIPSNLSSSPLDPNPLNPVPNPQDSRQQQVQATFTEVGRMSWLSFTINRLPLLSLPDDILTALRQGSLAYTKAIALARVANADTRRSLLEQTLAERWSLAQIRRAIAALQALPASPGTADLKRRKQRVLGKLQRSPIWDQPQQRDRLEALLADIETLLDDAAD
jgi:ParB-like chromosome segregation protein Spo0J